MKDCTYRPVFPPVTTYTLLVRSGKELGWKDGIFYFVWWYACVGSGLVTVGK